MRTRWPLPQNADAGESRGEDHGGFRHGQARCSRQALAQPPERARRMRHLWHLRSVPRADRASAPMKASDVMTRKVVTTLATASVAEAARLMVQQRVSGLPVVDTDGTVVGMITQGDLLRRVEIGTDQTQAGFFARLFAPGQLAGEYVHTHSARVGDVMTGEIVSAAPSTPLADIASLLQAHQVRRLPIVEHGRLVGIVSRADLLKALLQAEPAESAALASSDSAIRQRILARIRAQSWAPTACIDVKVESGIAELCGVFMDARERQALRVLAETTPGVKAVRDRLVWIEPISGTLIDVPDRKLADESAGR